MIETIAARLARSQSERPGLFILAYLIVTALLAPGILGLVENVEPSLEKVLPQTVEEVRTMNDMRTHFGADMMYLLVRIDGPVDDVRTPAFVSYLDALGQRLATREHLLEVGSIADLVKQGSGGYIPESQQKIETILAQHPQTPQLVNRDYSLAIIRIRSDTGASASVIEDVVTTLEADIAALEPSNPGSTTQITGFNAIDRATFQIIMTDFAVITAVAFALVALVVFLTFRSIKRGLLPLSVVMGSLIWTMGLTGYLGMTITVVSMVAAAMIMGLGIDFGIHVTHTYFHQRQTAGKRAALVETMSELLRAMVGASLTTTAGFLALLFGVLPAMKTLGIILGIGIMSTLLGAVFLLPPLIHIADR